MRLQNIPCPVCSSLNRDVDLIESDGWMECEECKTVSRMVSLRPLRVIPREDERKPVFRLDWASIR